MTKRKQSRKSPPRKGGDYRRDQDNKARTTPAKGKSGGSYWIYGLHAVKAALENPDRRCRQLLMTANAAESMPSIPENSIPTEIVERQEIDKYLPSDAVHQGVALSVDPLEQIDLSDIARAAANKETATVVVLDQATDPRNIGAVLRSATAFGALGVIVQKRHAPDETSLLAKAASGALETVPLLRVTNLSRAMDELKESGFWCIGFDGQADDSLAQAKLSGKLALVFGAEGKGLRQLTRENCDRLVRVPIAPQMESLNLSNTVAIGLYEVSRQKEG